MDGWVNRLMDSGMDAFVVVSSVSGVGLRATFCAVWLHRISF